MLLLQRIGDTNLFVCFTTNAPFSSTAIFRAERGVMLTISKPFDMRGFWGEKKAG